MDVVTPLKDKANELFKSNSYEEAIQLYNECLSVSDIPTSLQATLHSNKSQAYLKLNDYEQAVQSSTKGELFSRSWVICYKTALSICPGDVKALFRRCQAYEQLGKYHQALEDSRRLIHIDPKNKSAQALANRVEAAATKHIAESTSLSAKIAKMFEMVSDSSVDVDSIQKVVVVWPSSL